MLWLWWDETPDLKHDLADIWPLREQLSYEPANGQARIFLEYHV